MKNLAGVKAADEYIHKELIEAGIELIQGEKSGGEVPYSISGRLGSWKFSRAWYYWMASAEGNGLPLEIATQMHEKKYPLIGENEPENYGQVIRVAGNCGCPHPKEWAFPTAQVMTSESKRIGKDLTRTNYGDLAKLCNSGVINGERFVKSYHIDEQLGLNEFSRVLKEFYRRV